MNETVPTRVITLAQPGDDVVDHLTKAIIGYKYYQHDLIVIALYHNDLVEMMGPKYPDQPAVEQYLQKECPGEISKIVPWQDVYYYDRVTWYNNVFADSVDPAKANLCYLRETVLLLNKLPIPVLYYTLNSPSEYNSPVFTAFRQTIMAANGKVVSYNTATTNHPFGPVSSIELHPSAETHYGFAQQLAPIIVEVGAQHNLIAP